MERVFDWWRTAKGRICSEQERTPIGGARRESDDFNGLDDGGLQTQKSQELGCCYRIDSAKEWWLSVGYF